MRHAARQTPHRFHLLHLEELPLEYAALRDVPSVDDDALHQGIVQEIAADGLEVAERPVFMAQAQLEEPAALTRGYALAEHTQRLIDIVGVHQREDRQPHKIFGSVAEQWQHRGARIAKRPLGVEHRDDVHGLLDQRPEVLLALVQLLLHPLAVERGADRRPQAGEPVLQDVVRRSRLHVLDGAFLIERAGEQNERRRQRHLPRECQRGSAVELREIVVGNDEIGAKLAQGALELRLRRDPSRRELQARLAQLDLHQLSIGPHVLQQEDADIPFQFVSPVEPLGLSLAARTGGRSRERTGDWGGGLPRNRDGRAPPGWRSAPAPPRRECRGAP